MHSPEFIARRLGHGGKLSRATLKTLRHDRDHIVTADQSRSGVHRMRQPFCELGGDGRSMGSEGLVYICARSTFENPCTPCLRFGPGLFLSHSSCKLTFLTFPVEVMGRWPQNGFQ